MTCVYSLLAINAKSSHIKNCRVVTTWGSHFIFLHLLLITISHIWTDIKRVCMHIYKDAQCNEFCIVLLMGFWILVLFVEENCCIWVSFGPYAYMKKYEWHVPGIKEKKDTENQGTEWMFVLISSCHLTGILHAYWIPKFFIPAVFVLKKSVVSVINNNYFPLMLI